VRYLGNKSSLLPEIYGLLNDKGLAYSQLTLFDAFSGTGSVSAGLKSIYNLIINDNLLWCTQYVNGRLHANRVNFDDLGFDPFIFFEENKKIVKGFFYKNYSPGGSDRMYFTKENAGRIDLIRQTIQQWVDLELITKTEYDYLFYCLVESVSKVSNTTGVYGAFLKHWDPRSQKAISYSRLEDNGDYIHGITVLNNKVEDVIAEVDCDILYLDPPYTQNQYGTQYHLLETLAKYDSPEISKITGSRKTSPMRSDWSKDVESHALFEKIISTTRAKYIVFSYSKDGFLKRDYIESVLKRYGYPETYKCKKIGYKKYRNFKNRDSDGHFEYLFFIQKKPLGSVIYESPLNYTGSKFKMIDIIKEELPSNISTFYDIFGGGFNVGANLRNDECSSVVYNDENLYVAKMIESFYNENSVVNIKKISKLIKKFDLEPKQKDQYIKIRDYYNNRKNKIDDSIILFTIIMYGFQQQIRFNKNHGFNNPVGMRWFNNKIKEKITSFSRHISTLNCKFFSQDYKLFETEILKADFVYLDPPYRLTTGAYNDGKRGFTGWGEQEESELFNFLDRIDRRDVRFMLSYVAQHNGVINANLAQWMSKNNYRTINVDVQFSNSKKREEILIVNYENSSKNKEKKCVQHGSYDKPPTY
jgi:adenine-specific DNA-methyltransferase